LELPSFALSCGIAIVGGRVAGDVRGLCEAWLTVFGVDWVVAKASFVVNFTEPPETSLGVDDFVDLISSAGSDVSGTIDSNATFLGLPLLFLTALADMLAIL
jgi:hypothetical protein